MKNFILGAIIVLLFAGGFFYAKTQNNTANNATSSNTISSTPEPTATFSQQEQCGNDARDYMKQYSTSQTLVESAYSPLLQACVAYAADFTETDPQTGRLETKYYIYNVTTNEILGGYDSSQYKACPDATPTPTNQNPYFIQKGGCYADTGYTIITPSIPEGESDVSIQDYDNFLESIGLKDQAY